MCGLSVCVTVSVCMCFLPTPPLLCLKSFSRVTSLGHRAPSNQSHAASSRRVPALLARPRPSSALATFIWRAWELIGSLFFPLSMSHSTRLLKLHPNRMTFWIWRLKSDSWRRACSITAVANKRRVVLLVSLLYDGQMDGWMACVNCCLCFAALLLHSRLPKAFSDAWCAPNVSVVHLGFSSVNPPLQPSSLFIVPSLFLTVDALDVLMLFILKWQSILHCCCFCFL